MSRRRLAVIAGSFWRMAPAAALRGLGKGGSPEEAAALVEQRDAQAVHSGLADVLEVRAGQRAPEAGLELLELGGLHGVVEREHGHLVLDGGEDLPRVAGQALGGAVGRDEGRVRFL